MSFALPPMAAFQTHYRRYIGPLGTSLRAAKGANSSTHVASVDLGGPAPERAVVKAFHITEPGWFNEMMYWALAQQAGVVTPPRATVLAGTTSQVLPDHGEELNRYPKNSLPFVLWCTSAIEPAKNLQQARKPQRWDATLHLGQDAQRMTMLDSLLANCDRENPANTLVWEAQGGRKVAIDHERCAFNVDWTYRAVPQRDELPETDPLYLAHPFPGIKNTHALRLSRDKRHVKEGNAAANAMKLVGDGHAALWADAEEPLRKQCTADFHAQAAANLIEFVAHRATEDCIRKRLGLLL